VHALGEGGRCFVRTELGVCYAIEGVVEVAKAVIVTSKLQSFAVQCVLRLEKTDSALVFRPLELIKQ